MKGTIRLSLVLERNLERERTKTLKYLECNKVSINRYYFILYSESSPIGLVLIDAPFMPLECSMSQPLLFLRGKTLIFLSCSISVCGFCNIETAIAVCFLL